MNGAEPAAALAGPRSRVLRSLVFWLAVLITGGSLAFTLHGFDATAFAAAVTSARPGWILASVGLLAVALLIRALRWWALFDPRTRPSFALGAYGVPRSAALSYAVVLHAVNFFPYVLVGLALVRSAARRPPARSEEHEWND
jgi:uncharacterized membrane protein YbhN (UPF0104 family)